MTKKSSWYNNNSSYRETIREMNHRYYERNKYQIKLRVRINRRSKVHMSGCKVLINGKEYEVFTIGVLAYKIGRSPQTVRKWERDGMIPAPLRDPAGRRVYLEDHIDAIVRITNECRIRPGDSIVDTGFPVKVKAAFDFIKKKIESK